MRIAMAPTENTTRYHVQVNYWILAQETRQKSAICHIPPRKSGEGRAPLPTEWDCVLQNGTCTARPMGDEPWMKSGNRTRYPRSPLAAAETWWPSWFRPAINAPFSLRRGFGLGIDLNHHTDDNRVGIREARQLRQGCGVSILSFKHRCVLSEG